MRWKNVFVFDSESNEINELANHFTEKYNKQCITVTDAEGWSALQRHTAPLELVVIKYFDEIGLEELCNFLKREYTSSDPIIILGTRSVKLVKYLMQYQNSKCKFEISPDSVEEAKAHYERDRIAFSFRTTEF